MAGNPLQVTTNSQFSWRTSKAVSLLVGTRCTCLREPINQAMETIGASGYLKPQNGYFCTAVSMYQKLQGIYFSFSLTYTGSNYKHPKSINQCPDCSKLVPDATHLCSRAIYSPHTLKVHSFNLLWYCQHTKNYHETFTLQTLVFFLVNHEYWWKKTQIEKKQLELVT